MLGLDNCEKCGFPLVAGTCDNGCEEPMTKPPERMMKWFEHKHLPPELLETSAPFAELAEQMCGWLSPGPERTAMLRKLLEAKDAAVRAKLHPGG